MRKSVYLTMMAALAFFFHMAAARAARAVDPKEVFEAKCSLCHPSAKALGKRKTAEGWRRTVERMRAHAGGRISADDGKVITDYLIQIRSKQ